MELPLLLRQIRYEDDHDDGNDDDDDHDVVDDDNDLFQEALINARERGFRISYSLNPC